MSFIVVIPARAASSRLPDKPLLDLAGLPMVVRTANQARLSRAARVVVATDDERILQVVQQHGHEAVMTRADHPTGTDRLAEVVQQLHLPDEAVVVNVQGDEPLIDPASIDTVAELLSHTPEAAIATCAAPVRNAETLFNPNAVKVVCTHRGLALYFSRAPIPWARDALAGGQQVLAAGLPALHHIGLYAYRVRFLNEFVQLPVGELERYESLEQLRALENGYAIAVAKMPELPHGGVDTQDDLIRVRAFLSDKMV